MSFPEIDLAAASAAGEHISVSSLSVSSSDSLSLSGGQSLHRVRAVRREQGVAMRRAAQLMGKTVDELRVEEDPATDLTLSELYEWQRLLEVPAADLLEEPHAPLSTPVLRRAQMLRLMKTVQAIMERSTQPSVHRLAQTMVQQLVEIMPELQGITPWHSTERKMRNQNSRILESSYLHPDSDDDSDLDESPSDIPEPPAPR